MKLVLKKIISIILSLTWICQGLAYSAETPTETHVTTVSPTAKDRAHYLLDAFELFKMIPSHGDADFLLNEARGLLNNPELPKAEAILIQNQTDQLTKAVNLSRQLTDCSGVKGVDQAAFPAFASAENLNNCITGIEVHTPGNADLERIKAYDTQNRFSDAVSQKIIEILNQEREKKFDDSEMVTTFQNAMDRMKAAKVVPRYYESIIQFSKDKDYRSFQRTHDKYANVFRQAGHEYLPLSNTDMIDQIARDLYAMDSFSDQTAFERIHGDIRPHQNYSPPSILLDSFSFEDFKDMARLSSVSFLRGENDSLQYLFPEPFIFKPSPETPSSIFLRQKEDTFYTQYPNDVFHELVSSHPLLFTESMRNKLEAINDNPSDAPKADIVLVQTAVQDRKQKIGDEISYLENLKSELPSDALKELLMFYPGIVWQEVLDHPEYVPYICSAYQEIRDDAAWQKKFDRVKVIGSVTLGGLALLSGVGAVGLSALGASSTVVGGATVVSLGASGLSAGLGTIIVGDELRQSFETSRAYNHMYASVLADLGGDERTTLEKLNEFRHHVINAVMTGITTGVEAGMIFYSIRSLRALEEMDDLLTEAPEVLTSGTVSTQRTEPIIFNQALAQQRILNLAQAVENPRLKIFLDKVAEGSAMGDHIRPHAQRYLMEALENAEASGFQDLSKIQKLQNGLRKVSALQKELDEAFKTIPASEPTPKESILKAGRDATNVQITPEAQDLIFGNNKMELIRYQQTIRDIRQTLSSMPTSHKIQHLKTKFELTRRALSPENQESFLLLMGHTQNAPERQVKILQEFYETSLAPGRMDSLKNIIPHPATIRRDPETAIRLFIGESLEPPPSPVAGWHDLSSRDAKNLWSSQGPRMTSQDGVYHMNVKQNPTDPNRKILSATYHSGDAPGDQIFPLARNGEPLPKTLTGSAHAEVLGPLITTDQGRHAAIELGKSMAAYRGRLIEVANQLGGQVFTDKDFIKASFFLQRNFANSAQTAPLVRDIGSRTTFMVASITENVASPTTAINASQRIREGISALDELARIAQPLPK